MLKTQGLSNDEAERRSVYEKSQIAREVTVRSRLIVLFFVATFALLNAPLLTGQVGVGGSIVGTVLDPTGAVVPQAQVTITSGQTGVTLSTTTTTAGQYAFPALAVGTYKITVKAAGFEEAVIDNIALVLDKIVTQDVTLKIGSANQTVEVAAQIVHLEEHTQQMSTTLDAQTYELMPLVLSGNPTDPKNLSMLMPGVADDPRTVSGGGQAFAESISGGQTMVSEVIYDGAVQGAVNVAGGFEHNLVPVEALQEFSLLQNNYSAEYGRTPGGILSFNSKSGTSKFHGEAYEHFQNNGLDSRGFYSPSTPFLHQNEFGVNGGGPLIIPHVYNGKEKTFWFMNYSGYRLDSKGASGFATIPTVAMRAGDFSNYRDTSGNVIPIYDPLTTQCNAAQVCTRQQFSYNGVMNVIPPSRFIGPATAFNAFIPTPINNNQINNILSPSATTGTYNKEGIKIDHYFNPKYVMHGFLERDGIYTTGASYVYLPPWSTGGSGAPNRDWLFRLNQDITLSSNLLLHITAGFTHDTSNYAAAESLAPTNTLGIPDQNLGVDPILSWSGYPGFVGDPGQNDVENSKQLNGFVDWLKGRHEIKFGADGRTYYENVLVRTSVGFGFSNLETSLPSATNYTALGNSFASWEIGAVDNSGVDYYPFEFGNQYKYFSTYVQDNYKATSKLTLNFGVRYEIPLTRTRRYDAFSSFEPNVPNPGAGGILGALVFAGTKPGEYGSHRFSAIEYNLVQPRVGFAYRLNSKTVLRGGSGLFIGQSGDILSNGDRISHTSGFAARFGWPSLNNGITPQEYMSSTVGLPAFPLPPDFDPSQDNGSGIDYISPKDGQPPLITSWFLGVQRELPGEFMLDMSWVGNESHRLATNMDNIDQVNPKYLSLGNALTADISSAAGQATGVKLPYPTFTGTVAQALRPYPQYQGISHLLQDNGKSNYESLQVKLQRQFHQGIAVLASYTYSKLMTNAECGEGWYNRGSQNSFNTNDLYTVGNTVPPQMLALSYVLELPFGTGKRYVSQPGVARALLGGWAFSGIHHYQSGVAIGGVYGIGTAGYTPIFNNALYPNIVAGQSLKASWSGRYDPNKDIYLNPAAFSVPPNFTFGNASPNLPLRDFAYFNEDIALIRTFRIRETVGAEFRINAFNIFNRTLFSDPDAYYSPSNTDFGHTDSQANPARSIQLALKFRW